MMRRLRELLRERRRANVEMKRMKALAREVTCPGCGLTGPWIAMFIHPLCPTEDLHEPCGYCERMPLDIKFSRVAALSALGIPLSDRIIKNVIELTYEAAQNDDPTVNWQNIMFIQERMMETLEMEDAEVVGWPNHQPHKPGATDEELPLQGDFNEWDNMAN